MTMKMSCPICRDKSLTPVKLEERLIAHHCEDCGGHWISSREYHQWLEYKGEILPEKESYDIALQSHDPAVAKLCPECRRILTKYKVGHGLQFKVDHCVTCGFWLDKNEWEILKSKNLHDEITSIFTEGWQRENRKKENQEQMRLILENRLGRDGLEKLDEFRKWFAVQKEKQAIMAYLGEINL